MRDGAVLTDLGGQRWSVRVSTRDRAGATVYARKRRFEVGSPVSFDADDERTSALEYVLGAIGADLVVGMKHRCHRARLEIDSVEAVVHAQLDNALAYIPVLGERGHSGLADLEITVYVETLEDEAEVRAVWDEVVLRSPLYRTFSSLPRFDVKLQIVM